MKIASYIDHTLLKPTLAETEIMRLCDEASFYQFAAVCIPPTVINVAKHALVNTKIKVATVIGFPFGYSVTKAKMAELEDAQHAGADEFDVVINLIDLKSSNWTALEREMQEMEKLVHAGENKIIKVIIESGMLTDNEIISCCRLYGDLGVDFLKTSTGYAQHGASIEAVKLMKKHLPESVKIKASGGIRSYAFGMQLIDAGASRLGCSASVAIAREEASLRPDGT